MNQDIETTEQKLAKYHEFFSITHEFSINILPLDANTTSFEQFIANMPAPFKMASEVTTIDQAALRPLQALSGVTSQLVDFLNHQSEKINLLMGYILSQQDEEQHRYQGIEFGGGGLLFTAKTPFEIGQLVEMKIFLLSENCAVYCYSEIIEVSQNEDDFQHKAIFHFIREEDREVLVRTSLHEQSRQLQLLAKQRNQDAKT
ncbi:MAG: PilZ domain-containing protein [Colwellia sp.]|nr:PilZ domain-containing protein [Colwellia sp.]MCW9082484.1 PilZ domain-containing protein [Colwellia sp.]